MERLEEVVEAVVDRGLSNPRFFCFVVGMQLRVVVTVFVFVSVSTELEMTVVGSKDSVTVPLPTKVVTIGSVVDGSRRGPCLAVVVTVRVTVIVDCAIVRVTVTKTVVSCSGDGDVELTADVELSPGSFGVSASDRSPRSRTMTVEVTGGPLIVVVIVVVEF